MFLPRTIATAIDKIARTALGKDWSLFAALLDHWPEIVGTEYARVATPVKISFPPRQKDSRRSGGTLVIRIPKGLAMEFSFKTGIIRERITSYFGYAAIDKIIYETAYGAIPEPAEEERESAADLKALAAIRELAKDLDSDELREVFEAFCEATLEVRKG